MAAKSVGFADNMPRYLDSAGYPDVITLCIGENDFILNKKGAAETFTNFVALINATAAKRMLKDGILALNDVARYSGLTLAQVRKLQASMA